MLTLSLIKNSGGAAKYYAKEDNYYLSEADAKEASLWWGEGSSRLSLCGKVEEKALQKILSGNMPNGMTIGLQKDGSTNHRPGYDLCFHAPKSVSILALDGEDKRFYNAHLVAVLETLKVIEKDCAQAKTYKNNNIGFERTKNLTVALVRHTTSREQDLHLHHHALVMNVTQRSDNAWRALASNKIKNKEHPNGFTERVYANQIYYGLIYKNALASKVRDLGCELEIVGNHGLWEIKGVPQEARDIMSKRRTQIEERIDKLNYPSLKAADIITLDTREKKSKNIKLAELKQAWREELASVGFSSKDFINKLDKNKDEKTKSEVSLTQTAKDAISDSIEHLSQHSLKLDYEKIIAKALEFSICDSAHADIISAFTASVKLGKLIPLDKSDTTFVTKELIEVEKSLMDMVAKNKNVNASIDLKDNELNNIAPGEIKDGVVNALQSKNRLSLIQYSSDGAEINSTILKLAESSGKNVHILSPSRIMANDINENIKRRPSNVWQWLASLGKPEIGECIAGFKHKYKEEADLPLLRFRLSKDVIVVNNAETLGCSDTKILLELTEKTNAKLIFLQDTSARQGFTAGNSMQTLKQAGIETFKINEASIANKCIPELTAIKDSDKRIEQLARAYAAKENEERSSTAIFLGSKEQTGPATKVIREELKRCGRISVIEHSVPVLSPVYMSKPESTIASQYHQNLKLRFYENHAYQDWNIENIDKEKNLLHLTQGNKSMSFNPKLADLEINPKGDPAVFKKEHLQIAKGDKLIATASMPDLNIKNATKFTVKDINSIHIELLANSRSIKMNLTDLKDSHFQYDYATTLSRASKKPAQYILADIKSYALDKQIISELTNRAKESLTIFTDNAEVAQTRFTHTPVKLTAAEELFDSANIDRLINDKTVEEIRADIKKAINILGNKPEEKSEIKAVDFALEKITSRSAAFTHKELVSEAIEYSLKEQLKVDSRAITREDILRTIEEKQTSGELVMGRYFDDGTRWTTKKILDLERSIVADVKKGCGKLAPLLDQKIVTSFIEKTRLTQDQKNACHLIATAKDQFVMVQGYAGTGKTTMFASLQGMLKENNSAEILALAPTHRAVKQLKNIGIEAQTLKSFLMEERKSIDSGNTKPANKLDNKLIILDEDSMVSNKDFAEFLDIVGATKSHIVLSGDIAQHIAIESGKPVETIQRANILKIAYLKEIVRQKNLNLKSAVESTISKDYKAAFEKIENINPEQYIDRIKPNLDNGELKQADAHLDFFNNLKKSIVEIDNNKIVDSEKTLEAVLANDFVSRTPKTRDQTVIIVHANQDRKVITGLIRDGLKDQGDIARTGIETNCLVAKGLSDIEHKSLQVYSKGDVIKLGKQYYQVLETDKNTKSVFLQDEVGKTKYFYPEKYADKHSIEIYQNIKSELAVGDTIRLTKTDKERELYANFEYKVKDVAGNNKIVLESKDKDQKDLILNSSELKDAHWDYAQTVTGYGVQGDSKTYAIDFEVSYRKNLASQRSFYIGASRAIQHLIIYTDNKERLLNRILGNKGDKYAALEIVDNDLIKIDNFSNKTKIAHKPEVHSDKVNNNFYDAKEVSSLLNNSAESFVEKLLGRPNEKLSSSTEWRYGKKGSLVINISGDKRGLWHNFETGESGNLLILLQKETGLSFKESLKYVSSILGNGLNLNIPKREEAPADNLNKTHSKEPNKEESKTSRYAKQLAAESILITNTIAEKYLKSRGIENTDSPNIRYHPKVYTGKNEEQKYLPAIISIGRDKDGKIQCAQATYLDPKNSSKADLDVKKRTYASPSGASVLLPGNSDKNNKDQITFIAEGVETGLSVRDAVKSDVLVTLGKSNFINIDPQSIGQKAIFCLDNDGAKSFTDGIIHKAAERLIAHGKEVLIAIPSQINNAKIDFNDVTRVKGVGAVRKNIDEAISYERFSQKFKLENKSIGSSLANPAVKNKETDSVNVNSANSLKNIEQLIKTPQKALDLEVNII